MRSGVALTKEGKVCATGFASAGGGLTFLCIVGRSSEWHIDRRLRRFHEVGLATRQSVDD